jgi:transcriptional regulator with XRE-family HTH domain
MFYARICASSVHITRPRRGPRLAVQKNRAAVPARHSEQTHARTKLAELRVDRGIPQRTMAGLIGMGLTAYQALERGDDTNPRYRFLVNAATILGVTVDDLVEDEWREWLPSAAASSPPPRDEVWHTAPSSPVAQRRAQKRPLTQREQLERMARQADPQARES